MDVFVVGRKKAGEEVSFGSARAISVSGCRPANRTCKVQSIKASTFIHSAIVTCLARSCASASLSGLNITTSGVWTQLKVLIVLQAATILSWKCSPDGASYINE